MWSLKVALCVVILCASTLAYAQGVQPIPRPPAPPNSGLTPKYPPSAGGQSIGGNPSCANACTNGPVRFTPAVVEACVGETVHMNFRTETHADHPNLLANRGDGIENQGGFVDWGDGGTTPLNYDPNQGPPSWDVTHVYNQARQYAASATFGQQFTNANNPRGGCSYRCRVSQSADVTIYMKTAAVCQAGKFHLNASSAPKGAKASK